MINKLTFSPAFAALAIVGALEAQAPSVRQIAQERAQAELDAPKLAEVLELKPGMTVADIGAGGAAAPTNLPAACCDAIFLRHVYHHITDIELFNRSLHTSLKAGGRLAIIDFRATHRLAGAGRCARESRGHGIAPSVVISEVSAPGLTHLETIDKWPVGDKDPSYFLVLFRKP